MHSRTRWQAPERTCNLQLERRRSLSSRRCLIGNLTQRERSIRCCNQINTGLNNGRINDRLRTHSQASLVQPPLRTAARTPGASTKARTLASIAGIPTKGTTGKFPLNAFPISNSWIYDKAIEDPFRCPEPAPYFCAALAIVSAVPSIDLFHIRLDRAMRKHGIIDPAANNAQRRRDPQRFGVTRCLPGILVSVEYTSARPCAPQQPVDLSN